MAERSVTVGISADISKLVLNFDKGASSADKLAASITKAGKSADSLDNVSTKGKRVGDALGQSEKKVSAFGTALTKIDKHSADIDKISKSFLGVGSAALAGVGLAIKTAADFDQSMSSVAATGNDARQNIDALRDAAIDMGAKTSFSAGEAASGIENLLKAGVDAKEVIGGGLQGALDLAAAGTIDVGDAAEIAATAMTQFKLSGKDVPHIADLLAAGAGKAQGEVSDMGMALKQSGLVASQFGLNIEDTTGTLAAFASAGLIGSDAGTSFKTMLLALANPSKESAKLMRELGITAYDANGQFVGITSLAGQLQEKLGGLDQATRDQALAQIFGNDAVRAANVLYKQGSTGITDWIGKVNDSGYAAETAHTKLDNLKGDLEQLRGSLETALIGAGEGAQSPLREMVQSLTDLINKWNELDDATRSNVVKVVATIGGILVSVGILGKLAVAGSEVVTAFKNISAALPKAKTGIDGVTASAGKGESAMGRFGTAATGAGTALAAFYLSAKLASQTLKWDLAVQGAEEYESALRNLGETGTSDKIDNLFKRKDNPFGPEITAGVSDLDGALARLVGRDDITKFNDSAAEFLNGVGISTAWTDLKNIIGGIDSELAGLATSGNMEKAAAGFQELVKRLPAGATADQLLEFFPAYKEQLVAQANQLGITNLQAKDYADWMGGKIPPAIQKAIAKQEAATGASKDHSKSMGSATDAANQLKQAEDDLGTKTGELTKEIDKLSDYLTIMRGESADAEEATIDFDRAVLELKGQVDKNTKSLKINKDMSDEQKIATYNNRDSVIALMKQLDTKTKAVFADTAATKGLDKATDAASKTLEQGKEDIRAAGKAAGLSEKDINQMIKEMLRTPKELKTEVEASNAKKVENQIRDLEKRIKELEGKTVKITTNFSVTGTTMDFKTGKAIKIGNKVLTQFQHEGGPVQNLSGQGRKGVDTEVVVAGVGEHMLTDREVDAIGGHGAVYRLREAALRGELRGYRTGGEIRPRNLAGRPTSLASRIKSMHGRPDELEEIDLLHNLTGYKVNPKPLMDAYASSMGDWGEILADKMGVAYVKGAKKAMTAAYDGLPPGSFGKGTGGVGGRTSAITAALARDVGPKFGFSDIGTYPGHDPSETRALDFMTKSKSQGDSAAAYMRANAKRLNIMYLIWWKRIWSVARNGEGWRNYTRYGNSTDPSQQHYNHVHASTYKNGGYTGDGNPDDLAGLAHRREFVLHEQATNRYRPLAEAMNDGRVRIDRPYIRDTSPVSYGQTSVAQGGVPPVIIEHKGNYGYSPEQIAREEAKVWQNAMIGASMTAVGA